MKRLEDILKERILLLDGGFGTMVQQRHLDEAGYRERRFKGWRTELKGCNELLVLSRPEIVEDIHREYLKAGADIITADSFSANSISLSDYHLEQYVYEIARTAAELARKQADLFSTQEKPRFVAGTVGPTNKSLSIAADVDCPEKREITFQELKETYTEQITGLLDGGADIILIETAFDTLNVKAALCAITEISRTRGCRIPTMVSATIADSSGRMLAGQTIEAFYTAIAGYDLLSVGFNCGFGPDTYLSFVERLSAISEFAVSVHPNAGLPNVEGGYDETPESFCKKSEEFLRKGLVNIIGGCCGTTPEHISKLASIIDGYSPRIIPQKSRITRLSGLEELVITPERNFVNIGERTNVAGSAKFARLIREGNYAEALSVARNQVDAGAQIIDVCMDDGLIDGPEAMGTFLRLVASEPEISRVPVMVDSSSWETIEAGLQAVQGKCIVNSISLKEGEGVFLEKASKIKKYGAAAVVMLFDEQGQAVTYERKIDVARRAYDLLVGNGFPAWDIIFDPNILSIATGIEEHDSYGKAFIDATAWIRKNLPYAKVSGGVSNLSFAFRGNNRVREAMHSVFLYHAHKAGMDMGIVNAGMLQVYDEIEPELLEKVEDAVLNRSADAAEKLIDYASKIAKDPETQVRDEQAWRKLPLQERMKYALQRGVDTNIAEDTLEGYAQLGDPAKVIDSLLMPAMDNVGKLFGEGKMFLPQVVKSARVMKKSIAALTPYMTAGGSSARQGAVVIATVKGDVHDIGKNIVAVVMTCNGYDVHDLGVMVEPERIIDEAVSCNAVCIALSGLITPSLEEMRKVCELAGKRGLEIPVIIGGATTSEMHTAVKIAPSYPGVVVRAANASQNVQILSRLLGPDREDYISEIRASQEALRKEFAGGNRKRLLDLASCRKNRSCRKKASTPSWTGIRSLEGLKLEAVIPYINWKFFTASWGAAKNGTEELLSEAGDMLDEFCRNSTVRIQGLAGFFPARSCGDDIFIKTEGGVEHRLPMLRNQTDGEKNTSLSDFITEDGKDWIGLCSITAGIGLRNLTTKFRKDGDDYSAIMAKLLTDRLTEALAEYLRAETGCALLAFGYPSCPDHSLKRIVFDLLRTEEKTDMRLTENYMIDPGESICGVLVPDVEYFSVGKIDREQFEDYVSRRGLDADTVARIIPNNYER